MANRLDPGGELGVGGQLKANNGKTHLVVQGDGNVVLYRDDNNQALWASNTASKPVNRTENNGTGTGV